MAVRKKAKAGVCKAAQMRRGAQHPFGMLSGVTALGGGETEVYRQIRNAMALRGIASGGWGLVRHPAQSLEYILIPLLMNATNVAQDLSVAALTKGLGREGEHTSRTLIRMTVVDWLVMIVVTLPLALDIAGVI